MVLHWFFSNRKHNSMDEVIEVTKKVKKKKKKPAKNAFIESILHLHFSRSMLSFFIKVPTTFQTLDSSLFIKLVSSFSSSSFSRKYVCPVSL